MRSYQTLTKLVEKVHVVRDSFTEEDIDLEVKRLFEEIITRKRDDPFEGGLQAGGIIYPGEAAFKINENDGLAPHSHTYETLAQYLAGETVFSGVDTLGQLYPRKDDPHSWLTIDNYGFEIRLLAGKNQLIMVFSTKNNEISLFQLKLIEKFLKYAKLSLKKGYFPVIAINYVTRQDEFTTNDEAMTIAKFEELEQLIKTRMEEIKVL